MYERLLLLKELLSASGTIWVHLDWHRHAQLRLILDEVYGPAAFTNEVVWCTSRCKAMSADSRRITTLA
jgi:adenine specific DNA methylase Mod